MPNLHIVIYSELLKGGGGRETWLSYFIPGLMNRHIYQNIYVYCLKPRDICSSLLAELRNSIHFVIIDVGIPEHNATIKNGLKFTYWVVNSIKKQSHEDDVIILVGTVMEGLVGTFVDIIFRKIIRKRMRIVTWIRSLALGELSSYRSSFFVKIAGIIERYIIGTSNRIITNGFDTLNYYIHKYPSHRTKMTAIPNAVACKDLFKLDFPDITKKPIRIGFIGRLAKAKGFGDFLEAIKLLNKKFTLDLEYHVWGAGSTKEWEIPKCVVLHSPVFNEQIPSALEQVDVVVFLNHCARERAGGLSHALLEVMAAGRLIIAWQNPCHTQVLDSSNAILVDEGDIEGLTTTFQYLLKEDPKIFSEMIVRARSKAKEFSVDEHIQRFIRVVSIENNEPLVYRNIHR